MGAGAAEGAVDAANLLKPMLARGELRAVGATTLDEYRKHIEPDAALERRFQPVMVGEPDIGDTIAILRGLKDRYEEHHGVRITDPAIVAAATLSERYIADRFLPDKAIDLVDEAASRLKMEIESVPTEIDEVDRRIQQLEIEQPGAAEGEGRGFEGPARRDRGRARPSCARRAGEMKARWQNEKGAIEAIKEAKTQARGGRARATTAPSARPTSPRPAGSSTARSPSSRRRWPSRRRSSPSCTPAAPRCWSTRSPSRTSPRSSPSGPASPSRA